MFSQIVRADFPRPFPEVKIIIGPPPSPLLKNRERRRNRKSRAQKLKRGLSLTKCLDDPDVVDGAPCAIQITAPRYLDEKCLALAAIIERDLTSQS